MKRELREDESAVEGRWDTVQAADGGRAATESWQIIQTQSLLRPVPIELRRAAGSDKSAHLQPTAQVVRAGKEGESLLGCKVL